MKYSIPAEPGKNHMVGFNNAENTTISISVALNTLLGFGLASFTVLGSFPLAYLIIRSAYPPFRALQKRTKLMASLGAGMLMGLVFTTPLLIGEGVEVFFLFMGVSFLVLWGIAALIGKFILGAESNPGETATNFTAEAVYSHAQVSTDDRLKVGAMKSVLELTARIDQLKEELNTAAREGKEEMAKEIGKQVQALQHALKESRTVLKQIEQREKEQAAYRAQQEAERIQQASRNAEKDPQQLVALAEENGNVQGEKGEARTIPEEEDTSVRPAPENHPDWEWALHKTEQGGKVVQEASQGKKNPTVIRKGASMEKRDVPEKGKLRKGGKPGPTPQNTGKAIPSPGRTAVPDSIEQDAGKEMEKLEKEWNQEEEAEQKKKKSAEKEYKDLESLMLGEEETHARKGKNTKKA